MLRLLVLSLLAGPAFAAPAAWQVSDEAGNSLSLLGSVHYLRATDYPLPPVVDVLYERADGIVLELDLDDIDLLQVQAAFMTSGMLPADRSLSSMLSPEARAMIGAEAEQLGIDLALLERFEPWLAALTLMDLGMSSLGYRAERGLEQYLAGKAVADGKPILGLETLEAQIAIFDRLSDSEQEALLVQTLEQLASADTAMSRLLDAWRDGRLDALATELESDFDDFPRLYAALVVERNMQWIDRLVRLLAERRRYLVVVGALHLTGRDSVIELLRNRGLTVERLR